MDGHLFNDFITRRTPAQRWCNADDLKGAVIFLSSKASDFVNGHILYVDGGILASLGKAANELCVINGTWRNVISESL